MFHPYIRQYVTDLLELNLDIIKGRSYDDYYAHVAIGLVEEILELYVSNTEKDAYTKETGDVWAYATLILLSNELSNPIHVMSRNLNDSIVTAVADSLSYAMESPTYIDLPELALSVAGSFKRYFRGEGFVIPSVVAEAAASAFVHANSAFVTLTLQEVLSKNIEKLSSRKERGLLNKGKGDNR